MSGIGSGYDLSVGTFSPEGRIFQTDYAQKAVDNSGTVLGIRCKDGVLLGVEKTVVSKMLEEGTNRCTYPVDRHAGVAIAGLPADGRQVVNRALAEARNYKSTYGEPIPGKVLCERIASYVHVFNLYWYVRPFGTAMLMAVYDKDGPQLYLIEPSGTAHRYFGTAVGKGRQAAKTEIERLKLDEITCEEGVGELAKILLKLHDEEKPVELEMGWITDSTNRVFERVPARIVEAAEKEARRAIEEAEMEA